MYHFNTVGIIGKPAHAKAGESMLGLFNLLTELGLEVFVEERIGLELELPEANHKDLVTIGKLCDLAIVVGGDGFMLGAARVLSRFDTAVVGVNRGNLGFLTDLSPDDIETPLMQILNGEYVSENRFLLEVEVYRHAKLKSSNSAVNEAVLHSNKVAHMIQFSVHVGGDLVYEQRSDGLIVSTPTGSTAYSLSGGGPILTPNLDALALVPMFPHTLSNRPLVVDANQGVELHISNTNEESLQVSCDGHVMLSVLPGDEIRISKSANLLHLVHPKDYNYFNVLRSKLQWGSKPF